LQTSFYRDFYQKSLVPAELSDQESFLGIQPDLFTTHLMIGLQGHQEEGKNFYQWNVIIYQSDSSGIYDARKPVYVSEKLDRFDDALDEARKLEKEIRNEELHSMSHQEKIG